MSNTKTHIYENDLFTIIYTIDEKDETHSLICERKDSYIKETISVHSISDRIIPLYDNKGICFLCENPTNGFLCVSCKTNNKELSLFRKQSVSYIKIGYKNVSCDPNIKSKKENTCIKNHGVKNPSHDENIKKKISIKNSENYKNSEIKRKITNLEKYGVEHYSQTDEYKEKYKVTSLRKHGVENPLQSDKIKEKIKQTNLEKYGEDFSVKSEKVKEKIKQTNLEKYGSISSVQNDIIQNKIKNKNIEKYGVEHTFQRKDVIEKCIINRQIKKYGRLLESFKTEWRDEYFKNGIHSALEKYPLIGYKTAIDTFLENHERKLVDGRSKSEYNLVKLLESKTGLSFEQNVRSIVPSNNRLEIDIINKEHKISIEFNGYYYHQILMDKLGDDLKKAEEMRNNGWKHFCIDETDIKRINHIIDMININKKIIYGRNTIIEEVCKNEEKQFLNENHLFGYIPSNICYGLRDKNNKLLMIMSFGKDRFGICDSELLRLSTLKGYAIVGGAEKLFSYYVKNNKNIISINTYSDNKYFSGTVFSRLGFIYKGNTISNYIWKKGNVEYSRYQTMKHKLKKLLEKFDENMTENENMQMNGFIKIKDLGNKKWKWERD